jgi:hypothetical protein
VVPSGTQNVSSDVKTRLPELASATQPEGRPTEDNCACAGRTTVFMIGAAHAAGTVATKPANALLRDVLTLLLLCFPSPKL